MYNLHVEQFVYLIFGQSLTRQPSLLLMVLSPQQISHFYGTLMCTVFGACATRNHLVSQFNPVYILTYRFLKIQFNIILPPMHGLPRRPPSSLWPIILTNFPPLPCILYVPPILFCFISQLQNRSEVWILSSSLCSFLYPSVTSFRAVFLNLCENAAW